MRWLVFVGLALLSTFFIFRGVTARSRRRATVRLTGFNGRAQVAKRAEHHRTSSPGALVAGIFARPLWQASKDSAGQADSRWFPRVWLATLPVAATAAYAVTGSMLAVPIAVCAVLVAPRPVLKALERRKRKGARECCESLGGEVALHLACGMPVADAVRLCPPEQPGELSSAIEVFNHSVALGECAEDAFMRLARELRDPDLELIAYAVLTSRETGSDIRVVTAAVGDALRERTAIRREIRTQTAQGRLSGQVVAGLPLLFLGLSLLVSRDSVAVLLGTAQGLLMMGAAVLLDLLGYLWIKKILDVDDG